ncbi:MAG: flavodoxin domain-containing protein [Idiomarina sp.]|nr:flavodoxin domain-containing protein [Idiomarina sp.]
MQSIHILVGTTSGNTEFLAGELEIALQAEGHTTTFHDLPAIHEIPTEGLWLLCVATHGAGEYAESIVQFMEDLAQQQPNLAAVRYALVAIGDSSYDTYCQAGLDADQLLSQLGATRVADILTIDMMLDPAPETTATKWLENWQDHRGA